MSMICRDVLGKSNQKQLREPWLVNQNHHHYELPVTIHWLRQPINFIETTDNSQSGTKDWVGYINLHQWTLVWCTRILQNLTYIHKVSKWTALRMDDAKAKYNPTIRKWVHLRVVWGRYKVMTERLSHVLVDCTRMIRMSDVCVMRI